MTIRIVTDSTCDLPQEVLDEHGITVVPLYIHIGEEGYLDGVEMSREEFYRRLPEMDEFPRTAAPGPGVFKEVYDRLAAEGATEIISIHISHTLSGTMEVARIAARMTSSCKVTAFDSGQLSMGTGLLAVTAAKLANEGRGSEDVLDALQDQSRRSHVFAALDTLEFLKRSGRMNWAVARIGSLLKVKPILTMNDGKADSIKVRTDRAAFKRIADLLRSVGELEQVVVVHTFGPERIRQLVESVRELLPSTDILEAVVTPVIGAHIGPRAVGFACVAKR